jgi:hypothetical protein
MNKRSLAAIGAALLIAGLVAFVKPSSMTAAGSGAKTAWGDPDVQGIWAQKYQTPLQRPARDAGKATLTPEEVKRREADRVQRWRT